MYNKYTVDKNKQEIIIDDTGFQVMMEWEKPYMEALINNLQPFGDVLEIGFGFGYSASTIQQHDIKSHTIIESDPEALIRCQTWANKQPHKVNIIEGCWQDKLKDLQTFDSIFFDDAPNQKHPDPYNIRLYKFFYDLLDSHVKPFSRLTWYCDTAIYWLNNPFTNFTNSLYDINLSNECQYIESDATLASMPVVTFTYGCIPGMKRFAFTNTCEVIELAQ